MSPDRDDRVLVDNPHHAKSPATDIGSDNGCSVGLEHSDSDSSECSQHSSAGQGGTTPRERLYVTPSIAKTPRRPVERVCAIVGCGRTFKVRVRDLRRATGRRGRYCSPPCASRGNLACITRRADQRGEANGNFKNWATRNKRAYVNRFRSRYPEKAKAHDAVKNALARGVLVRPVACQRCDAIGNTAAHHEDYSRPLDVVFVCRSCHRKLDKARRERLAQQAALSNVVPVRTVLLPVYDIRAALVDGRQGTADGDDRDHEGFATPESIQCVSR